MITAPADLPDDVEADADEVVVFALGGVDFDDDVIFGAFTWVPKGCSMEQGSATSKSGLNGAVNAHFSTVDGSNNNNNGGYILICKERTSSQVFYLHQRVTNKSEFI